MSERHAAVKKNYRIGQEIIALLDSGRRPIVMKVEKVGTKYIIARSLDGFFRKIVKSTGRTTEGEKTWCSWEEFECDVTVSKKLKEVKAMIDSFDWSKCSMAKLFHIAEAFEEDETRLATKAFMRKIGMID